MCGFCGCSEGADETSAERDRRDVCPTNYTQDHPHQSHHQSQPVVPHATSCDHTVVVTWTGELPLQMHRDRLGMSGVSNEYGL